MFLGIDVGTGGTRAVLVDRRGLVVASAASEHAAIRSEHIGWAEQEPEDWWRAARKAITGAMAAAELTGAEIRFRRPHRPDARMRHARRRRQGPAPRTHLVRPENPARVRLAGRKDRPRAPDRTHLQSRPAQLYPHQTALGQSPSAGNLRPHRPRSLPQGLRPLSPDRRVRHRHAGGQRNPASRRRQPPLVGRSGRRCRNPHVVASAAL